MQLIQIGITEQRTTPSIREMFEALAEREAEMVRAARERMRMDATAGNARVSQ